MDGLNILLYECFGVRINVYEDNVLKVIYYLKVLR